MGQRVSGYWNELELETLQFLFLVLPSFAQYLLPPTSPHHHSITTRNSSWYRGRGSWMRKGPQFLSRKSWAKAGTPRLSAVLHHSAAALSWNPTGTVGAGRMSHFTGSQGQQNALRSHLLLSPCLALKLPKYQWLLRKKMGRVRPKESHSPSTAAPAAAHLPAQTDCSETGPEAFVLFYTPESKFIRKKKSSKP